jgi:hypothetical protein
MSCIFNYSKKKYILTAPLQGRHQQHINSEASEAYKTALNVCGVCDLHNTNLKYTVFFVLRHMY